MPLNLKPQKSHSWKSAFIKSAVFLLIILSGCSQPDNTREEISEEGQPIPVGILHSRSGPMSLYENSIVEATIFAIKEINDQGGIKVGGRYRKIETWLGDGNSSPQTFATEAERLIKERKVDVLFGCWNSLSRKEVKPLVESFDSLLFYPASYEGLEQSPNIIYTGGAPNQITIPAINWTLQNLGTRIFLVGSESLFSRAIHEIIKDQLSAVGGEIAGEALISQKTELTEEIVSKIQKSQATVIIESITGTSKTTFYKALKKMGVSAEKTPTLSFTLSESDIERMGSDLLEGNYAVSTYFQAVNTETNKSFIEAFRNQYGPERIIDSGMEAAYSSVFLWAQAVESAGSSDPKEVRKKLVNQSFDAPGGRMFIDPKNQHTYRHTRIAKIGKDDKLNIVWETETSTRPDPFPIFRTPAEWRQLTEKLKVKWGHLWLQEE